MPQQIILGMGAGQCGFAMLKEILEKQRDSRVTFEQWPILPWVVKSESAGIRERIDRWKEAHSEAVIADVAAFYLPYVEEAVAHDPTIRCVCLKRSRNEIVSAFIHNLDAGCRVPTNHWAKHPGPGWYHDPLWMHAFPQYDTADREEGIIRYWEEYYRRADELARRYPENFLLIDAADLTQPSGVQRVLEFVEIPATEQVPIVGTFRSPKVDRINPPQHGWGPLDPRRCVVLVPFQGFIHPECEESLKELERRGYEVRRVGGYAAIDQGRNQMATDALMAGFEETLWIDADVGFHADDVTRLRSHPHGIVTGIYPQKGKRALASHVLPKTPNMTFGEGGGLVELLYAATGFMLVRRQAYLEIQRQMELPVCNERFAHAMIPFFLPMIRRIEDGNWYLAEDYSFCERARRSGIKIWADTRIRLWHVGWYRYGWEDAGIERPRFNSFTLNFGAPKDGPPQSDPPPVILERLSEQHPWPSVQPEIRSSNGDSQWIESITQAFAETVPKNANVIVEIGSSVGQTTLLLSDLAKQASIVAIDDWNELDRVDAQQKSDEFWEPRRDLFLATLWNERHRVIPIQSSWIEGLQKTAAAGLVPQVVHLSCTPNYERTYANLSIAVDLFPSAVVVGTGWEIEAVHRAVQDVANRRRLKAENLNGVWRVRR